MRSRRTLDLSSLRMSAGYSCLKLSDSTRGVMVVTPAFRMPRTSSRCLGMAPISTTPGISQLVASVGPGISRAMAPASDSGGMASDGVAAPAAAAEGSPSGAWVTPAAVMML